MLSGIFLYANTTGEAGFQILKIDSSPAASAQAGTGEFSEDLDAFMFLINPASSVHYNKKVLSSGLKKWIVNTNITSLGYLNSMGNRAFGISVKYFDIGKIERRDNSGDLIGAYYPFDLITTTNFSFRLYPTHHFGFNISLLYEQIDTSSSYGFSTDLGYLYLSNIKGLRFAAAIKNLGYTSKMNFENIKLPLAFTISSIKDFNVANIPISTELTLIKNTDDDLIKINYGINATYLKVLTLRLGYKFNYDTTTISGGLGIKIKKFRFDYAFIPNSGDLGDAHHIGLTYLF